MKGKRENVLIFDIGSASVGGSVVVLTKGKKPQIVFSTRSKMAFQEKLDFDHFVHSMLSVLLNVSMEMRSGGIPKIDGKIDRVLCVLSSPWYISQTKIFDVKKKVPFDVTVSFLESLMKDAIDSHKKEAVQIEDDPVFIEREIIQTKINGYPVTDIFDLKTDNFVLTAYSTIMSKDVHEKIKKMINKVFNVDDFIFRSFTTATYSVIRDLFMKEKNFLLVDVSGETTNVSIVYDEVLMDSASFPLGHNSHIRAVQGKLYSDPEEAVSRIKIQKGNEEMSSESIQVESTLSSADKDWVESLKKALDDISEGTPLPSTLFLTGGNDYVDWFVKSIEMGDFSSVLFVEKPFKISVLNDKQLKPCCEFTSDVHIDAFLTLSAIYMNRYLFA